MHKKDTKEFWKELFIGNCHGCCHEAIALCSRNKEHEPSGERTCFECKRNPMHYELKDNYMSYKMMKIKFQREGNWP